MVTVLVALTFMIVGIGGLIIIDDVFGDEETNKRIKRRTRGGESR